MFQRSAGRRLSGTRFSKGHRGGLGMPPQRPTVCGPERPPKVGRWWHVQFNHACRLVLRSTTGTGTGGGGGREGQRNACGRHGVMLRVVVSAQPGGVGCRWGKRGSPAGKRLCVCTANERVFERYKAPFNEPRIFRTHLVASGAVWRSSVTNGKMAGSVVREPHTMAEQTAVRCGGGGGGEMPATNGLNGGNVHQRGVGRPGPTMFRPYVSPSAAVQGNVGVCRVCPTVVGVWLAVGVAGRAVRPVLTERVVQPSTSTTPSGPAPGCSVLNAQRRARSVCHATANGGVVCAWVGVRYNGPGNNQTGHTVQRSAYARQRVWWGSLQRL